VEVISSSCGVAVAHIKKCVCLRPSTPTKRHRWSSPFSPFCPLSLFQTAAYLSVYTYISIYIYLSIYMLPFQYIYIYIYT
jgi:hypothetical protein